MKSKSTQTHRLDQSWNHRLKTGLIAGFIVAFSALYPVCPLNAAAVLISDFSDAEADNLVWDSVTKTWTGTQAVGGALYVIKNFDLSQAAASAELLSASLLATINSTTVGTFTITLEDGNANIIGAVFQWSNFGLGSPQTVTSLFSGENIASFNLADVVAWNLVSNSSNSSVDATFSSLSVIPEPSSGALMALGAVGLVALRRLRKI